MDAAQWMVNQLMGMAGLPAPPKRYNPRPRGKIHEGSGSDLALEFLKAHPTRCFQFHEIVAATGKSTKAVGFGLIYLAAQGLIESYPHPRNARYYVYKIKGQ
jgi:hypothetical protein